MKKNLVASSEQNCLVMLVFMLVDLIWLTFEYIPAHYVTTARVLFTWQLQGRTRRPHYVNQQKHRDKVNQISYPFNKFQKILTSLTEFRIKQ